MNDVHAAIVRIIEKFEIGDDYCPHGECDVHASFGGMELSMIADEIIKSGIFGDVWQNGFDEAVDWMEAIDSGPDGPPSVFQYPTCPYPRSEDR